MPAVSYERFANVILVDPTLTADPGTSGTTLTLTTTAAFPQTVGQFRVRVGDEVMLATSPPLSGTTLTVVRAQEGTTAVAHGSGVAVSHVITAGAVNTRFDQQRIELNVQDPAFGAKGDTVQVNDGAMTSGSATLTSATAAFTAADVGKVVSVTHATSASFRLSTTIASVTNGTTVVLAAPATVAGSGKTIQIDGARSVADAVTSNNSTTLTSATAAFVAGDVGKQITITTAAAGALNTTISAFTNSTTVTLAASATRTCTAEQVIYGTDDTAAFISVATNARDLANYATIYVPKGWYSLQPSVSGSGGMALYSKTQMRGDGWASILRMIGHSTNDHGSLIGINHWNGGSADPTTNLREIMIRDIHLQGHVAEDGFMQWRYLLEANAVTDLAMERVKFSNFQGDGVYLGSATQTAVLERHNISVSFDRCLFDGINRDNRNGITVIDGEDVVVSHCTFRNCTRMDMPGAIDLEPNIGNVFSVVKGIHVDACYFYFCGGNSGHVGAAFHEPQLLLTVPFSGYTITNCVFRNGVSGQMGFFFLQDQYPQETTARNDVLVAQNYFYGGQYAMEIDGIKGVEVRDNVFTDFTASAIFGYQQKSLDIQLSDNTFVRCANALDGINEIVHADRLVFDRNTYDNCGDAALGGASLIKFVTNGGGLSQPSTIVATAFGSGGTLGAATRSYRLTSYTDNGETLATSATTAVTSGTTARVDLTWVPDVMAAGTKVYGRTGGTELLMATLGWNVGAFSDTGSVTPSGALPGGNTTAQGYSNGVRFTRNTARQGPSNRLTRVSLLNSPHKTTYATLQYQDNQIPASVGNNMGAFGDTSSAVKASVRAASTATVSLPPGGTTLTIDGVALANGDRVLLKDQTAPAGNGIYVVDGISSSVILTRSQDANTSQGVALSSVAVTDGTLNRDTTWTQTAALPITLETTAMQFTRVAPAYPLPSLNPWAVSGNTLAVIGETMPRATASATWTAPTTATHTLFGGTVLPAGETITNVNFHYTTAAGTITVFYVSLIRLSDLSVLATSSHSTTAWASAPATKTVALNPAYTPNFDTPAYVGIALASSVAAIVDGAPARVAAGNFARAPILTGTTTTPTTTPISGTAGALTATLQQAYLWLT